MESSQKLLKKLQLDKQRRRQHELERATAKEKEMEELRKKQEEKVQAAMKKNEEKTDRVMRENKEMEVKILRQNKEREEKVLRENNEKAEKILKENKTSLALLMDENKAEMAALVEKQEKEDRLARKRKADGPLAPDCPVCAILYTIVHFCLWSFLLFFVVQICLTEMKPPTRIFQCSNGHHVCETCK